MIDDDPKGGGDLYYGVQEDCAAYGADCCTHVLETRRKDRILPINHLAPNALETSATLPRAPLCRAAWNSGKGIFLR